MMNTNTQKIQKEILIQFFFFFALSLELINSLDCTYFPEKKKKRVLILVVDWSSKENEVCRSESFWAFVLHIWFFFFDNLRVSHFGFDIC